MKKFVFLCLILPFAQSSWADHDPEAKRVPAQDRDRVDERRVEEVKREDLKPTQGIVDEEEKKPQDSKRPPPVDRLELAYLMDLMQRKFTYRYDAIKAVVLILGVENEYLDLDSQLNLLREKKILPKRFEKEFDVKQPLRKGLFAYMIAKTLDLKGGILMRLFGMSERYAIKSLAFEGILPDTNKQDLVAGDEFVIALQEASRYYKKYRAAKGAVS